MSKKFEFPEKYTSLLKVFFVIVVVASIFKIFGAGYNTGQWIYDLVH